MELLTEIKFAILLLKEKGVETTTSSRKEQGKNIEFVMILLKVLAI